MHVAAHTHDAAVTALSRRASWVVGVRDVDPTPFPPCSLKWEAGWILKSTWLFAFVTPKYFASSLALAPQFVVTVAVAAALAPAATAFAFVLFVAVIVLVVTIAMDTMWKRSTATEGALEDLHDSGLLPAKGAAGWRAAEGQEKPASAAGEIVNFVAVHERGLALPTCIFVRSLLLHYGVCLHHLNPNGIL